MVVFASPYSELFYDGDKEILQVTWKKRPTNSAFTEMYLQGLAFVKEQTPVNLYCIDLTAIGPLNRDQEDWLSTEFYPNLLATLNTKVFVAVVFTDVHFNAIITNYTATEPAETHEQLLFNYFTDREEANHWLESVKKGQDTVLLPTSFSN